MRISIEQAVQALKEGNVVVFPTETVYGLGALATSVSAVDRIYQVKQRPRDNPLICHFYDSAQIERYGIHIPPLAQVLMDACAPGPISFLLNLPLGSPLTIASGGRSTVLCRIPNHAVALQLLRAVDVPVAAPSANTSGRMSGTRLDMIEADLGDRVAGYLDGGDSVIGVESTIIDVRENDRITILRPGIIGKTELLPIVQTAYEQGFIEVVPEIIEGRSEVTTPGSRYAHYAPITKLRSGNHAYAEPAEAYLATDEWMLERGIHPGVMPAQVQGVWYVSLGSVKDLSGVARRLYYALYQLDQLQVSEACFIDENWGETSIARALRDRIAKILAC